MGNIGPFSSYGSRLTLDVSACLRLGFIQSEYCKKSPPELKFFFILSLACTIKSLILVLSNKII